MREYLKDLDPKEVIDRLNNGERVYYEDTRGNIYFYKVYKGMTIRYNEDGEVDGYNRSIYSTGEAYFDVPEDTLHVKVKHHYRTRNGKMVYIKSKRDSWYEGTMFLEDSSVDCIWTIKGEYYPDSEDPRDLVEELD